MTASSAWPSRSGRNSLWAAPAYPRVIDFERMADIAHGVGATLMVDMAHIAGLVAAGAHPSPLPRMRRGDVDHT